MKGKRLPTLAQVLRDAVTSWTTVTVCGWYSEGEREAELTSATGVWYHSGMSPLVLCNNFILMTLDVISPSSDNWLGKGMIALSSPYPTS